MIQTATTEQTTSVGLLVIDIVWIPESFLHEDRAQV